ncbi:MAG: TetR family transcriptional regulator [Bacteroidetes bacterium]|nr:TetR family transcriptional regulator [Rhodothermia bacterium]MCS7154208.1 TetR family transcriptional regulator [Bacteroidota bacterium]MCX7906756.1 TetR family transcriptional regulator [Bacteroidota bacterium]MDW8136964.1 TetR family transcriptional regulator [Bacteroidota bacterium]MDW8285165.1 TetR family transcriptional regulator [Bacteroidota bacterium]
MSSATRERLLKAAEELFGEYGFDATSVRAIGERAGVNPALVHYYFGSKVNLLAALLAQRSTALRATLWAASRAEPMDLWDRLRVVLEAYMRAFYDHHLLVRLVFRELALRQRPELTEALVQLIEPLREPLYAILSEGVHRGRFHPVDPDLVWLTVMGALLMPLVNRPMASALFGWEPGSLEPYPEAFRARLHRHLWDTLKAMLHPPGARGSPYGC